MVQKRKVSLPKITDFLSATSSRTEHESAEKSVSPAPMKHSKHHDSYNLKWADEFTWLRYVPADQEDGPSMLCMLCRKHTESSKRMVWLSIPCKLFWKDKLREHERSQCHMDAVKAEAMAVAARCSGGICACMEEQVSLQQQAVRGAYIGLQRRRQHITPSLDLC